LCILLVQIHITEIKFDYHVWSAVRAGGRSGSKRSFRYSVFTALPISGDKSEEKSKCPVERPLHCSGPRYIHFVNSSQMVSMLSSLSTFKTVLPKYLN
jgi:hypothetical protein